MRLTQISPVISHVLFPRGSVSRCCLLGTAARYFRAHYARKAVNDKTVNSTSQLPGSEILDTPT